jgi:hypothetical protein
VPVFSRPYREQTYLNQTPGGVHPAYSPRASEALRSKWLGYSTGAGPDGLEGAETPALLQSATGSSAVDGVAGAIIGYFAATRDEDRVFWGAVGGAAGMLMGTLGLLGVGAAGIWARAK